MFWSGTKLANGFSSCFVTLSAQVLGMFAHETGRREDVRYLKGRVAEDAGSCEGAMMAVVGAQEWAR
jgi:hypothetical protein